MAKAEIKRSKITYVLELEPREATVLWNVMCAIGGGPVTSDRRHCEGIRKALEEVMLPQDRQSEFDNYDSLMSGSITFKEYRKK